MAQVRLARDWTDDAGVKHHAGDLVEVSAATQAELQKSGVVKANWAGPTDTGTSTTNWAGPTGGDS
jgi:hypothetical protein